MGEAIHTVQSDNETVSDYRLPENHIAAVADWESPRDGSLLVETTSPRCRD